VIEATYLLLAVAAAGFTFRLVRGPSLADRTLGLNGLVLVLMGAIACRAAFGHGSTFLPTLIALAVVGPVGNGMIARFIERRAR
jgi:multicomponent Na+:H+ antiporter subunit F